VLGLGLLTVIVLVRRGDLVSSWMPRLVLASGAVIPVAWHVVLRNHTAVHFWFTYRSFAVAFGIVLMALTARVAHRDVDAESAAASRVGSPS
jgi:hypothetical protein